MTESSSNLLAAMNTQAASSALTMAVNASIAASALQKLSSSATQINRDLSKLGDGSASFKNRTDDSGGGGKNVLAWVGMLKNGLSDLNFTHEEIGNNKPTALKKDVDRVSLRHDQVERERKKERKGKGKHESPQSSNNRNLYVDANNKSNGGHSVSRSLSSAVEKLSNIFTVTDMIFQVVEESNRNRIRKDKSERAISDNMVPGGNEIEIRSSKKLIAEIRKNNAKLGGDEDEAELVMKQVSHLQNISESSERYNILSRLSGEVFKDAKAGDVNGGVLASAVVDKANELNIPPEKVAAIYNAAAERGRNENKSQSDIINWIAEYMEMVHKENPDNPQGSVEGRRRIEASYQSFLHSEGAPSDIRLGVVPTLGRYSLGVNAMHQRENNAALERMRNGNYSSDFPGGSKIAPSPAQRNASNPAAPVAQSNNKSSNANGKPGANDGQIASVVSIAADAVRATASQFDNAAKILQTPLQVHCTVDVKNGNLVACVDSRIDSRLAATKRGG